MRVVREILETTEGEVELKGLYPYSRKFSRRRIRINWDWMRKWRWGGKQTYIYTDEREFRRAEESLVHLSSGYWGQEKWRYRRFPKGHRLYDIERVSKKYKWEWMN